MHTRFFAFYSMYRLESIICCVDQISQTERNMKERDRGTRASSVGGWWGWRKRERDLFFDPLRV